MTIKPANTATGTDAEAGFAERVLAWYDQHGRHDLPWQQPATPYRVWISEIMLQQTRVETVKPYFSRFLERFPDVATLAAAPIDDVMAYWAGLGYYARARNLHRAAQQIVAEHGGELPDDIAALQTLPGIGRSTAGAIQSLARGRHHAILDGNVKRVLARHAGIEGWPGRTPVQRALWTEAEARTPVARVAAYNQAMMDLGASICLRQPRCMICPVAADCRARLEGTTAAIPAGKPKRTLPTREAALLVLQNRADGAILVERRANQGIWGGLWSLPEFDDATSLAGWLASRGIETEPEALQPVDHGFTHFHFRMHPYHAVTDVPGTIAEGNDQAWTRPEQPPGGLPAPIAKLLARISAPHTPNPADAQSEPRPASGKPRTP